MRVACAAAWAYASRNRAQRPCGACPVALRTVRAPMAQQLHTAARANKLRPHHNSSLTRLPRLPGRLTARGCAPGHAPDGQDYDARTPAHLAACEGHAKVLELLLANGADPSLRDRRAAPRM